ncbi:hypothetical protein [Agrococcus sp. SGAir0287]|uniref:hypothetical protein n=1 Tax=Agrococcus sp. SGAir0287 TaxID=2070347 RepID=UPI0010CCF8CA|nr:hypothetical protein [Agrococcus sp. SGAir0287]QCR20099.1 hypothetical protein C1N71_12150 [Agrococcus sp. SGAir0287]
MAATTDDARARADDPALAATSGFSFARRSSPGHLAALVLGGVLVLAGAVGFGPIAAWASAGGDGAGWVAPVVLLVVGAWLGGVGLVGVLRARRTWTAPDGAILRRERYRLRGSQVDAQLLWDRLTTAPVAELPRLPEGRVGPIVVSTYVDRAATRLHATVVHREGDAVRAWPVVTREDAGAARYGQGSGPDEAPNPITI